ncbi:hypothetical protein V6N13_140152 [Hibiscus sabdariffa]
METNSSVTVIGAEAPSAYHMVPRVENGDQIAGGLLAVDVPPISVGLTGSTEKKKRGRPRKYGPDGTMARALSPMPISSSIPPGTGDLAGTSFGTNFTPHIITVNPGEDVTMKVISFSQQGPRAICILSANGVISNVTLRQPEPDSSGGMLTYEGHFEILSLSGSFIPTETQGTTSRSGGMSVSLVSPDGRVVGGAVAGLLVVATPVQVVVGSFFTRQPARPTVQEAEKSVRTRCCFTESKHS